MLSFLDFSDHGCGGKLCTIRFDTRGEDIWCAGVVLLIMATGQMPFNDAEEPDGDDGASDISYVPRGLKPMLPHYLSRDLVVREHTEYTVLLPPPPPPQPPVLDPPKACGIKFDGIDGVFMSVY